MADALYDITERDIDALYQLPLAEFTAARDALATRAGSRRAEIRKLEKPNAAAWGVNQLYWRRRKTFDRLLATFERVRSAQAKRMSGRKTDLQQDELMYRAASDQGVEEVRALLTEAGNPATGATIDAVRETFVALPFSPMNGRLTRPLRPVGFSALAGLMSAAAPRPVRTAEVISIRPSKPSTSEKADQARAAARDRQADQARRAEIARVERDFREAKTAERAAETKAARASAEAARARETRAGLREELDTAEEHVTSSQEAARLTSEHARKLTMERQQIENQLARLKST